MRQDNNFKSLCDFPFPETNAFEENVLCDIVSFPENLLEARKTLTTADFSEKSGRVWNAICQLDDNGMKPDIVNLSRRITKEDFNDVILRHISKVGSGTNFVEHVVLLKEASLKRMAYATAVEILNRASTPSCALEDVTAPASRLIEDITNETKSKRTQKIVEAINNLAENLQQGDRRVPTGIKSLDKLTYGGFNEGNLVILAARPSVGKTATALYMMMQAAMQGRRVFMASLEMTNTELAQRYMFSTELVKPKEFAKKQVDWNNFERAASVFSGLDIYINDEVKTIDEIVAEIRTQVKLHKVDIAYIDYLGLIKGNGPVNEPPCILLGKITARLKELAKELHIPIVVLCQLNRNSVTERRTPQLFDLRDSGSIEQDADIVLMLNKPESSPSAILAEEEAGEDGEDGPAAYEDNRLDMWLRKNRNGKRDIGIALEHNYTHTIYTEVGVIKE